MTHPLPESAALRTTRSVGLGTLRAVITLLVVLHHAALAYHQYGPPPAKSLDPSMLWGAFPVVDAHKWPGIDALVGFNDVFFMSLLFLLSGVFAWPSLQRKGPGPFLRDRLRRLGIPFVFCALILAPLAYYPAYLQTGASGVAGFAGAWLALPAWPAGPAWFLWVLLAFGAIAAALQRWLPGWGGALGRLAARVESPAKAFLALLALSAAAYLPLALAFGPVRWFSAGPFFVQSARPLHYFAYYLAGIAVSANGLGRGLLVPGGKLARRFPLWALAALAAFGLAVAALIASLGAMAKGPLPLGLQLSGSLCFVLSCAASSFAFLALFARMVRPRPALESLGDNAYGIYLTHYPLVTWLQWLLLPAPLSGAAKCLLVFGGAVAAGWGLTATLRRVPSVARVI